MENNTLKQIKNVTIIGDGGWGTALALLLDRNGVSVTMWSPFEEYSRVLNETRENTKFLPGFPLPKSISITNDSTDSLSQAELLVIAIPSHYLREVVNNFSPEYNPSIPVLSVVKGIEAGSLKRMSEVLSETLRSDKIAVLSGPSHAEEVANRLPATVVISSEDTYLSTSLQQLLMDDRFRVYTSEDVIGVEVGGSIKNVLAIAAGICDGLCLGSNAKAALLTRGIAEMTRLGLAMGGSKDTFFGLSGIGDLITTCISPYGRNRSLGEQLAKGKSLQEIVSATAMVMEGMETARSVKKLSEKYHVEMPISLEVYNVLYEDKNPLQALQDLMVRTPKSETGGY